MQSISILVKIGERYMKKFDFIIYHIINNKF